MGPLCHPQLLLGGCCAAACRLLAVVAVSKWLMATVPSHTSVNTCSGLVTLYALHSTELLTQAAAAQACIPPAAAATVATSPATAGSRGSTAAQAHHTPQLMLSEAQQVPVLPDLLLVASVTLACPGLLADTAQLLLAAMLQPAPPGTYLLPTLPHQQAPSQQLGWTSPQQQPQQQPETQVFTSPGAAAAASCWPPVVLQLAVLHAQQQPQQHPDAVPPGASLAVDAAAVGPLASSHHASPLWLWLPQLVLSTAAAVAHPTRMPPELLAAVSAGLLDVLLGAAPAPASCAAASWLCQVLRGSHWDMWRPYLGKPCHLAQRWAQAGGIQHTHTDTHTKSGTGGWERLKQHCVLTPRPAHAA